MGRQSWGERGRRAWSRLSQHATVRNGVRTLVFAGAVGVTWLIGSSAASAHHATDPEAEGNRKAAKPSVERTVETSTGVLDRWLRPDGCTAPSQRQPGATDAERAEASSHNELSADNCDPADSRDLRDSTGADTAPTENAAPDTQALPRTASGQHEEGSKGTANADPDRSIVGPLAHAARPVTQGKITAVLVNHTEGTATGLVTDVIAPVTDTAGTITRPVTDRLTAPPVTDEITDRVLPGLSGVVPLPPVAGLPQGNKPAAPAPPVAPGVDQSIGSTSTVDLVDEALSGGTRQTGQLGAGSAPSTPVPAPPPAVPGSGVLSGYATGSYVPLPGGGATATVPAFLSENTPISGASPATAFDATLRDLAGEPAVSPD
ncbi:MAG: hypothetical protein ACRDT4_02135 [Micromonosporaceae bacterium]